MEAIIAAAITAIASVVIALIQAGTTQKQARLLRKQQSRKAPTEAAPTILPEAPSTTQPVPRLEAHSVSRTWLWVGGIVIGSIFLYAILLPDQAEDITHWGVIPWSTCLLAFFRPTRWGYVAAIVTLLHGIAILSEYLIGGWYDGSDIPTFSLIFIGNAVIAAGIAFLRQRGQSNVT